MSRYQKASVVVFPDGSGVLDTQPNHIKFGHKIATIVKTYFIPSGPCFSHIFAFYSEFEEINKCEQIEQIQGRLKF